MSLGISEMILNKTCELHWDLSLYLVENGKQIIRDSQVRIVFQLVVSIIDQKDMMCPDSRDIVLSDTFLEKLTNKPWLHVTQVRDEILARMTISGVGRPLRNASDNYKHLVRRFFPSNPSRNEGAHALPTVHAVIPLNIWWVMEKNFSVLLLGYESTLPARYDYILSLVTAYITRKRNQLLNPRNLEIASIKHDPLYNIFGVSFFHRSQLRGIVRDHVTPVLMND